MVEWYPHVLVVSTLIPRDEIRPNVVEFYPGVKSSSSSGSSSIAERATQATWKRPWKMMKSGSGWTVVAGRYSVRGRSEIGPLPVADGGRNAAFLNEFIAGSWHRIFDQEVRVSGGNRPRQFVGIFYSPDQLPIGRSGPLNAM